MCQLRTGSYNHIFRDTCKTGTYFLLHYYTIFPYNEKAKKSWNILYMIQYNRFAVLKEFVTKILMNIFYSLNKTRTKTTRSLCFLKCNTPPRVHSWIQRHLHGNSKPRPPILIFVCRTQTFGVELQCDFTPFWPDMYPVTVISHYDRLKGWPLFTPNSHYSSSTLLSVHWKDRVASCATGGLVCV